MSWLEKILPPKIGKNDDASKHSMPEGVWSKCEQCASVLYEKELTQNFRICPSCGSHQKLRARQRIELLLDGDSTIVEIAAAVVSMDPLKFLDKRKYTERLKEAQKNTGEREALIVVQGNLQGMSVVLMCFEFEFLGGSMGSVVGERFRRAVDYAIDNELPVICCSASGGARMQEGMLSLMQMAKTNASLSRLAKAKLPFISVLTDPTMGGVSASFAFMGDVVLAEPNALVGFAGQRVIENTVRQTLPESFQRAEFLLGKGALDMVVERSKMKAVIANCLRLLMRKPSLELSI